MDLPRENSGNAREPESDGDGLRGVDKRQGDLRDTETDGQDLPQGLRQPRKGPLGPRSGRRGDNTA